MAFFSSTALPSQLASKTPGGYARAPAPRWVAIVSPLPSGGAVVSAIYRMRAYDSTLARVVFWNATIIDTLGASYGGPGPLVDVVVHMLLGT